LPCRLQVNTRKPALLVGLRVSVWSLTLTGDYKAEYPRDLHLTFRHKKKFVNHDYSKLVGLGIGCFL